MTSRRRAGAFVLVLTTALAGCNGNTSSVPPAGPSPPPPTGPTPPPTPPAASSLLHVFTEPGSSFSTSDLHDVDEQILQFNTAGELIWADDGTRLQGYRVGQDSWGNQQYYVQGKICAEGCAFVVRFGTRDGERRAYLTVDYGHDNPGTLVNVEVEGGALVVIQTSEFPPGTPTLSGVVTEMTPGGLVPIEGAFVYRGVQGGWQGAATDRNGFYRIQGLYKATDEVDVGKDGFKTEKAMVSIDGDTRYDVQLVRP